jgi:lysyl-tRNA synthetase class II
MCFRTQSYLVIMLLTIRKFTVQSYNNKFNSSWKRAALNFVQKRTFSDTSYLDMNHDSKIQFGNYDLIASAGKSTRKFTDVQTIGNENGPADGQYVWVRGRLNSLRTKGNAVFAILRTDGQHTIQACHFKDKDNVTLSKELIKFIDKIPLESIIDIFGQVVSAEVRSCSKNTKEIAIKKCFVVSKALTVLPFLFEDASRY